MSLSTPYASICDICCISGDLSVSEGQGGTMYKEYIKGSFVWQGTSVVEVIMVKWFQCLIWVRIVLLCEVQQLLRCYNKNRHVEAKSCLACRAAYSIWHYIALLFSHPLYHVLATGIAPQ